MLTTKLRHESLASVRVLTSACSMSCTYQAVQRQVMVSLNRTLIRMCMRTRTCMRTARKGVREGGIARVGDVMDAERSEVGPLLAAAGRAQQPAADSCGHSDGGEAHASSSRMNEDLRMLQGDGPPRTTAGIGQLRKKHPKDAVCAEQPMEQACSCTSSANF